jgi:hypothetical protein
MLVRAGLWSWRFAQPRYVFAKPIGADCSTDPQSYNLIRLNVSMLPRTFDKGASAVFDELMLFFFWKFGWVGRKDSWVIEP